jgi:hypothetical protein
VDLMRNCWTRPASHHHLRHRRHHKWPTREKGKIV